MCEDMVGKVKRAEEEKSITLVAYTQANETLLRTEKEVNEKTEQINILNAEIITLKSKLVEEKSGDCFTS